MELGGTLPADISAETWRHLARRPAVIPLEVFGLNHSGEDDQNVLSIHANLLRRYYNTSILERDSRMAVFWGDRLIASLRRVIPDMQTPRLDEPLNVQAQLLMLGFHLFPESDDPSNGPPPLYQRFDPMDTVPQADARGG